MRTRGILVTCIATAVAAAATLLVPAGPRDKSNAVRAAHGSPGYAYAGYEESSRISSGVRATITARRDTDRVGRSRSRLDRTRWYGTLVPNGETMWLQAGIAALPRTPSHGVRRDHARPAGDPVFLPLLPTSAVGEKHRPRRARDEQVDPACGGSGSNGPARHRPDRARGLPQALASRSRPRSRGTAASDVNGFRFRFERVGVARSLGGSWRPFVPGVHVPRSRLRRPTAAPGAHAAQRTLPSIETIAPYAFDAQSI